jgi:phage/plasmid-associated DNA primase
MDIGCGIHVNIDTNYLCPDQTDSGRNMHWMVRRTVNTLFTGRTEIMDRIQDAFCSHSTVCFTAQKRFVITGLGGQGKSEISLKAASLMRQE